MNEQLTTERERALAVLIQGVERVIRSGVDEMGRENPERIGGMIDSVNLGEAMLQLNVEVPALTIRVDYVPADGRPPVELFRIEHGPRLAS